MGGATAQLESAGDCRHAASDRQTSAGRVSPRRLRLGLPLGEGATSRVYGAVILDARKQQEQRPGELAPDRHVLPHPGTPLASPEVAVKVLKAQLLASAVDRARFLEEAAVQAALAHRWVGSGACMACLRQQRHATRLTPVRQCVLGIGRLPRMVASRSPRSSSCSACLQVHRCLLRRGLLWPRPPQACRRAVLRPGIAAGGSPCFPPEHPCLWSLAPRPPPCRPPPPCQGPSLAAAVHRAGGPWRQGYSWAQALAWLQDIAGALAYLHHPVGPDQRIIIHRWTPGRGGGG